MTDYVRADKLVRPGRKHDFGGAIPALAVERLIGRGVLQGKTARGKTMVLADDALARVMQLGIEPFAFNQQGWCFAAVEAPIDRVGHVMRQVLDVKEARQRINIRPMGKGDPLSLDGVQPLILVKLAASNWALLVVRREWFDAGDWTIAEMVASEASSRLKTRAIAAAKHDASGAQAEEWRNGKSVEEWSDLKDDDFYVRFYEREIAAPSCWMSFADGSHVLMSDSPRAIERADFFAIIPPETETRTVTFAEGTTGEDVLRQFAQMMGIDMGKKGKKGAKKGAKKPKKKPTKVKTRKPR